MWLVQVAADAGGFYIAFLADWNKVTLSPCDIGLD